jgi:hypothetical protein
MAQRPRQRSQAQQKLAQMRQQQRRRERLFRGLAAVAALAAAAVIAVVVIAVVNNHSTAATSGHMASGATVDGIACQSNEQVAYHIHAHLAIFDNGVQQTIARGIGIPGPETVQSGDVVSGKCFYWLHTHDASGIIHIESPTRRVYTLGQFFDLWGQPLSGSQVGRATGTVTVFVNGKRFSGDPRSIALTPHKVIQLDVGKAVPPKPFTFAQGL